MPIATKSIPSQNELREIFYYDGKDLIWRKTSPSTLRFLGKIAGYIYLGYRRIRFDGEKYFAARLIWKYIYGVDPLYIDHINGNKSDNRIENLRSVDVQTNRKNLERDKRNISGTTGVSWDRFSDKWRSVVCVDRKQVFLGRFDSLSLAAAARNQANIKDGFHPNHGRGVSL